MARPGQDALQLELLRMRASIERAELQAGVAELRSATLPLFALLGSASGIAQRIMQARRSDAGALASTLFTLLRERPWLLSAIATVAGGRSIRRWLLLAGVAALGAWFTRSLVAGTKGRG